MDKSELKNFIAQRHRVMRTALKKTYDSNPKFSQWLDKGNENWEFDLSFIHRETPPHKLKVMMEQVVQMESIAFWAANMEADICMCCGEIMEETDH